NSEIDKIRGKKRFINSAVYQKGLSLELVESCHENQELDWFELCRQCFNKKYRDINKLQADIKLKQKEINYLIYNDYIYDEIN
ncbi:RecX family transcriptional regulator, partial [Francisella tularensis subsp. holarctica]